MPAVRETPRAAALLFLFLVSGCAALIYEIVWFQQLCLVLGATSVSLAILLACFMGGMGLGSFAYPRCISPTVHPLRAYATIEALVAGCGLAILWIMPIVSATYCRGSYSGSNDLLARSLVAIVTMLVPTALMGATLPALGRFVRSDPSGAAWLGWYYAANLVGGMIGCLLSGLYLLRQYDVYVATSVAVVMNVAVAVIGMALSWRWPRTSVVGVSAQHPQSLREPQENALQAKEASALARSTGIIRRTACSPTDLIATHFVVAVSGLTALGGEVIWTRHLGLLLGPTVYTFSIILAVFLFGLGLGGACGAWLGRRVRSPTWALAMTQLGLLLAIPYAAFMIVNVVPYWLVLRGTDEFFTVRVTRDILRTLVAIVPATCLWGASFPLAVAVVVGRNRETGRLIGGLSATHTFGAITGALLVGLYGVSWGAQSVQQGLTLASGCSGVLMLTLIVWRNGREAWLQTASNHVAFWRDTAAGLASLTAVFAVGSYAVQHVAPTPNSLLADGRWMSRFNDRAAFRFVAEGLDSPIVVSDLVDGTRCFHVAGKIEASTRERDVRTQRLLGHLPALAHPEPKKVLVIGCGSGMTAGTFLFHPSVEEIVICEMETRVIEAARDHFAEYNHDVVRHSKTRIVHDDARHFLATTSESFDIITADPIHPWVRGSATLYTSEFFQLCKSRLSLHGVVTLWVPLYESNEATAKCELATFLQQFPTATIWSGQNLFVGYDLIVLGTVDGRRADCEELTRKLEDSLPLRLGLTLVGIGTANSLQQRFVANLEDLGAWLTGAQINRDCNLRLQYLAGTNPDQASEHDIFQAMLRVCRRAEVEPLSSEDEFPLEDWE
ncbi:fused MFS/spermidine synthase [Schlesneria paludicola]|uniref:fused MFS/spermidine synthase n=1 Tax=Schlesneria paludicola TaxID=360056 RepID=UPI00029B4259|nr:fused MFS/spermidine synthase [Schlesneria paludicola]